MGTRNLTMVVHNGKTVVGQYGQWDGYPGGQGMTALTFLVTSDMEKFKTQLAKCKFVDDEKRKEINDFAKSLGSGDGWMTKEQGNKFDREYPYFTRDNAAEILNLIYESKDETIWLENQETFAANSLFCEWAYVVDLDKKTFEVYQGFNETPLVETERFYPLSEKSDAQNEEREKRGNSGKYQPVKLVKSYSLDDLPTVADFLTDCNPQEEEEEIEEDQN